MTDALNRPDYRPYLPDQYPAGMTAEAHTADRIDRPRLQGLINLWKELSADPFKGITATGEVIPGLYSIRGENAPTAAMAEAASKLLSVLSAEQRKIGHFPIDSGMWQQWQNTELMLEKHGLRLDGNGESVRGEIMNVVRASLSEIGYERTLGVMRLNGFLGDLIGYSGVLGEWSFKFCLFGTPSTEEPWGWQLFGHHLCVSCFVFKDQMVLTPSFFGAEPAFADQGPNNGLSLFEDEERIGLELMRGLSPDKRDRAIVYQSVMGGDLPEGRWHYADHLHMGGAHQDNRVVPYEGLKAADMSKAEQQRLLDLTEAYLNILPAGPLAAKMGDVERHLADTHFCWIGGTGEADAFYYRIQSTVVFIEFDLHTGVFLTNKEPQKFHVHTIIRTPNGNDYGIDLLRRHYAESAHHHDHD